MSAAVLDMSISLDGFIAGPNAGPGNGLGDGGQRLHDWALTGPDSDGMEIVATGVNGQVFAEVMSTGAVVAGRGTFEPAGGWGGDHHNSVPIFIPYRQQPGIDISHWPLVTAVNDITNRDHPSQGRCRREERARPRSRNRQTRPHGRRPR